MSGGRHAAGTSLVATGDITIQCSSGDPPMGARCTAVTATHTPAEKLLRCRQTALTSVHPHEFTKKLRTGLISPRTHIAECAEIQTKKHSIQKSYTLLPDDHNRRTLTVSEITRDAIFSDFETELPHRLLKILLAGWVSVGYLSRSLSPRWYFGIRLLGPRGPWRGQQRDPHPPGSNPENSPSPARPQSSETSSRCRTHCACEDAESVNLSLCECEAREWVVTEQVAILLPVDLMWA